MLLPKHILHITVSPENPRVITEAETHAKLRRVIKLYKKSVRGSFASSVLTRVSRVQILAALLIQGFIEQVMKTEVSNR